MDKPNTNDNSIARMDDLDLTANADNLDLFSEELEDRFNADAGSTFSTASTLTSCWGTASCACSFL